MGTGNREPGDFAPTEKERIDELFRELEIEDMMLDEEDEDVDEITDFTEAGFEPGDFGIW